ncbi:dihydropteroate synthase [Candidatus Woesearchaeota archaeon]|nr:dihydropteroate synthase [Candidatus Woesearchaeota archaeon]
MLKAIKCGNHLLNFDRTLVMGVLNITPDSFSDGGLFVDVDKAVKYAAQMVEEGADMIDVGGESTRPGSEPISDEDELARTEPIIKKIIGLGVPISVDTYKPFVARKCIELGAHIINDITGLGNQEMINLASELKVPIVIMHMKGKPKNMQQNPAYRDVVNEIKEFLKERILKAKKEGIDDVIVDPGIGFGKTTEHNLQILKRLEEFKELKCPVLVGPSRKSFIGSVTGLNVDERLEGTLASVAIAVMNGANIVRVHDVRQCKRAVQIAYAVRSA